MKKRERNDNIKEDRKCWEGNCWSFMMARSHSFGVQLARVVLCSSTYTAAKLEADYAYESSRSDLLLARYRLSLNSAKSRVPFTFRIFARAELTPCFTSHDKCTIIAIHNIDFTCNRTLDGKKLNKFKYSIFQVNTRK